MAAPIVISILTNARQANAGLNETNGILGRVGATARRMAVPVAAGVAALVVGGKQAIDSASDLSEETSKSGVIFGKSAKEIRKFAADAEQGLGQSKRAALEAASTFGQIGQKAGLGTKESAKFSKQFVTLASDMASFNNTTPEEAVEAIGSAMRGEAEPIRKYGVMLDDATLRNRALKEGLISNVKQALTPQQKALAASKEILAQTSKAQGDFARTSDGAANKGRILAAQSENLKAKIGTGLLPVYVRLLTLLSTVLSFLDRHQETFQRVASVVTDFFGRLGNGSATAGTQFATFRALVATALENVRSIFASTVSIVTSLWARFGSDLTRYAVNSLNNLMLYLRGVFNIIAGIFKTVAALLRGDWRGAWEGIQQIARGALQVVTAIVRQGVNLVRTAFSIGLKALSSIASAAFGGLRDAASAGVGRLMDLVRGLPGRITGALSGAGSLLSGIGGNIVDGLVNGIKAGAGKVADAARSLVDKIPGPIRKALGIASPSKVTTLLGRYVAQGLAKGIALGTSDVIGSVTALAKTLNEQLPKKIKKPKAIAAWYDEHKKAIAKGSSEVLRDLRSAAKARLAELKQQRSDYAAAVRDAAKTYAGLGSMTVGENENVTSGGIAQYLRDRLSSVLNFNSKLSSIRGRVTNDTYDQIVQMGVEQGTAYAEALSGASPAALAEVNALQAQINAATSALGASTAGTMFNSGVQAAQGYYDGLQAMLDKIQKQGVKIAKSLVKSLRKALGIKSPSRVLREIGRQSVAGLDIGLDARQVQAKGEALAKSLVKGYANPQLDAQFTTGYTDMADLAKSSKGTGDVYIDTINVQLDSSMTIEQQGVEYDKALKAAKKIGMVRE